MRYIFVVVAAAMLVLTPAAFAQSGPEEIVVTASRRSLSYADLIAPHIALKQRASFAVVGLDVQSDTRDFSKRQDEIRQALRDLLKRARPGPAGVTLALVDDDTGIVRDFSMAAVEDLIREDKRDDTSRVTIRLKTPIGATDTLEAINARIRAFVSQAAKPGRIEMEVRGTELTLVNPEQYRQPLIDAIVADGRKIAGGLGEGYGISVSGLEQQIAWRRSGDLELTLFLPYTLSVAPQPR